MYGTRMRNALVKRRKTGTAPGSLGGVTIVLILALLTTEGCRPGTDPLEKAFNAVAGKAALLELKGFSYESSGERFEPAQGRNPAHDDIKASSFALSLLWDVENNRLSFDWQREIFNPPQGKLAYKDVIDGAVGYQTGNDFYFNPPDATSDRALSSERIGALRREFLLLNPQLYLRALAADENAGTIKDDVELDGRTYHVIEVTDDVLPVELFIDAVSGRLVRLQTLQNDHLWGDVLTVVTYNDWSASEGDGLMFPHRVEMAVAGKTLRTDTRTELVVNPDFSADAFSLPAEPRTHVDRAAALRGAMSAQYVTRWNAIGLPFGDQDQVVVTATEVRGDRDVQYLTGGSHHSLAIRLGDGIVVVEPPPSQEHTSIGQPRYVVQ